MFFIPFCYQNIIFKRKVYKKVYHFCLKWQKSWLFGKNNGKNDGQNLINEELTENEKRILLELINNPSVPYDQLVIDLKISRRTVSRVFVSLVEKGYIERIGTNKKGYWKIIK